MRQQEQEKQEGGLQLWQEVEKLARDCNTLNVSVSENVKKMSDVIEGLSHTKLTD